MATLDKLFAEAGLTPPQRTNRNRTVTTPGSYEAPVEGIQDYESFQRGFTAGITPGLIEKKKQDVRVDAAAKEFDALKLTELIETSDTDPIAFKKNAALRGQTLSLLKGDLRADYLKAAKFNDTESMNNILSQVSNLSEGITNLNTFLTESQKTDQYDMEASNYKIGNATYTDAEGNKQALTFNQLADVNNNNPEALSYVQRKDKYGAVDTFLTVKNSKYGSFEVNISDLNAAQIQNRLALNADYGTETSSYLKDNPKIKQNTTAWSKTTDNAQKGVRTTSSGSKITDEVDVENRNNATAFANNAIGEDDFKELRASYLVKALKREDIVNTETVKGALAALKSEEGMQKYADANNITLDQAKNDVKTNVDKIIRTSLENEYLKRTGSYEWDGEKYVKAVLGLKISTSPISDDKDTGPTAVTSFMEDIFSRFNAVTSGASNALKDSEDGVLEGEKVENTLTLLRGKKYNGKLITDVKYTKVGELKNGEPDLRLQVFTQTGDDEIPQKSLVDISDAGSRREFLENIARSKFGEGTAISKEIAQAYTNIQTTRSEVQSVFGIYSDRLRKTLETGKWDDKIDPKYRDAFDSEMKKRKENSVNNDLNPN
jgi:hypothetical protein